MVTGGGVGTDPVVAVRVEVWGPVTCTEVMTCTAEFAKVQVASW